MCIYIYICGDVPFVPVSRMGPASLPGKKVTRSSLCKGGFPITILKYSLTTKRCHIGPMLNLKSPFCNISEQNPILMVRRPASKQTLCHKWNSKI